MLITDVSNITDIAGKIIEFTKNIENYEAYPESGMRARVKSFRYNIHNDVKLSEMVHEITFDYTEFDMYNTKFEQSNYYDKQGNPCLTAREAGLYNTVEGIYFDSSLPLVVVDDHYNSFKEQIITSYGDNVKPYLEILHPYNLPNEVLETIGVLMEKANSSGWDDAEAQRGYHE